MTVVHALPAAAAAPGAGNDAAAPGGGVAPGQRAPRALLFCHAAGYFGGIWRQVSLALRAGWPRYALDFRGHGEAGPLPPGATWQAFAGDVATAARRLAPAVLAGVGHSLGGTALLLAEAAVPGTFAALVCYEPVLATAGDPRFAAAAQRRRERFGSRAEALAHLAARPPFAGLDPRVLRDYVDGGLAGDPGGGVRLRCRPHTEAQVYRTATGSGWAGALPGVGCPTVFVRGSLSTLPSAGSLAAAAGVMPRCRVVTFEGAGHLGPLERPQQFARVLDGLLSDLG
jgi:pimeloyl-ACP methyl ester carboxylesterase